MLTVTSSFLYPQFPNAQSLDSSVCSDSSPSLLVTYPPTHTLVFHNCSAAPTVRLDTSSRRDEGVSQILIRNKIPATMSDARRWISQCSTAPIVKLPNQHDYSPRLKWRRRLHSREILQLLHGSRQLTLSVSHPGSVNLDAGAPTSTVVTIWYPRLATDSP